jgi:hypothetical protein
LGFASCAAFEESPAACHLTRAPPSTLTPISIETAALGLGDVGQSRQSPLNLSSLLAAVEAAPPVAAVDVLAAALAEAIGARKVSFLIADFSGRSLIRLGHSGGEGALRLHGQETAERVPLAGTPHGRALAARPSR